MKPCIFCQIVDGKLPASTVYEDDICLAFMDIHPLGDAHVLVVPKKHAVMIGELTEPVRAHIFRIGEVVVQAQRNAGFGVKGTNFLLNDGKAANQTVGHVHLHLIPRKRGDLLMLPFKLALHVAGVFGIKTSRSKLDKQAEVVAAELKKLMPSG